MTKTKTDRRFRGKSTSELRLDREHLIWGIQVLAAACAEMSTELNLRKPEPKARTREAAPKRKRKAA